MTKLESVNMNANGVVWHDNTRGALMPLIYKKMSDVMREIGAIGKDQKNQAQGFKFRGIDQFVNALYPALTRNGVFMAPRALRHDQEIKEVVRSNGKTGVDKHVSIMMEYTFYAEDGSSVVIGPVPAEGLDSGDKATNKALSAALKYALIQTFSIPTEDMAEGDLDSPEMGTTSPSVASRVEASSPTTQPVASSEAPAPAKRGSSFRRPTKPLAAEPSSSEGEGGWE
jgi:ERF superfamily